MRFVQNLKYAFRFIKLSFKLALKNENLQKPWMILSLGNLALLLAAFIPLAMVIGLIGLRPIGMIFIGLICALFYFCLRVWGEITALKTSQLFDQIIHPDGGESAPAAFDHIVNLHGANVVIYALAFPVLKFYYSIINLFSKPSNKVPAWLKLSGLVLPLNALEDYDLQTSIKRLEEMQRLNLLRFRPEFIPVDFVSRLVDGLLFVIGVVLGFVVGFLVADPLSASTWQMILGGGSGLLVGGILITIGIAFSTFTRACYHTSLYRWAKNVETAQKSGETDQVLTPIIISQVLGRHSLDIKESSDAA